MLMIRVSPRIVNSEMQVFLLQKPLSAAENNKPDRGFSSVGFGVKQKYPETEVSGSFGADYWTRTSDLMRVKHAL